MARLAVSRVCKSFAGVQVLDNVNLEVAPGEVHGLIGQNGSGKSTLIKLLSGFHRTDTGTISIDGEPLHLPINPNDLRRHGVAFVHQDLGLVDDLSVVENVRVGMFSFRRWTRRVDWLKERAAVAEVLERLGVDIDENALVSELSTQQRAVVALARALQNLRPGLGCIVLDEATQLLPRETLPEFYAMIRELSAQGTSFITVSHRMDEVSRMTDRVTVLRDGRVTGDGVATADTTQQELIKLMLGRDSDRTPLGSGAADQTGPPTLKVEGLTGSGLHDVDLAVRAGEVVGITGLTDSGIEELPYLIAGARPAESGRIRVGDRTRALKPGVDPVRKFIDAGVVLVPGNRAGEGLAMTLSVLDNLSLPCLPVHNGMWVGNDWQLKAFDTMADTLGIVPRRPDMMVDRLSGGNQQKLLLAKWLTRGSQVLLTHEPTQAVDVGARRDLLVALRAVADSGTAVIICSIEAEDLAQVCDRVLVMRDGRIVAELSNDGLTVESILRAVIGGEASPEPMVEAHA